MAKKSLFSELASFKKANALKSVSTKITQADGTSVLVDSFNDYDNDNDAHTQRQKTAPTIDDYYQTPLPKLSGFTKLPFSYDPATHSWRVRNDTQWQAIEFDPHRLSLSTCAHYCISTIVFHHTQPMDNQLIESLIAWLKQSKPTVIVMIHLHAAFVHRLLNEAWIRKMYYCTDDERLHNGNIWNALCLSSVSIKHVTSSLLYSMHGRRNYFIQVLLYFGATPINIAFCSLDGQNPKQRKFQWKQILDYYLAQNMFEHCVLLAAEKEDERIMQDIDEAQIAHFNDPQLTFREYFESCSDAVRKQETKQIEIDELEDDVKDNIAGVGGRENHVASLIRSDMFKVSALVDFDANVSQPESSVSVCANCVYFER